MNPAPQYDDVETLGGTVPGIGNSVLLAWLIRKWMITSSSLASVGGGDCVNHTLSWPVKALVFRREYAIPF